MIIGILVLGLILRLITINQSLWLDEAINVLAAKNLPFWHFVTGYPLGDFHPPGYFAILWIWSHIFGYTEISVRMPSVLLGVATIFITYLLGKDLFNKRVGIISALLLAIGPLHIYYSQEARMYALAAFSVALSCLFLVRLLKGGKYAGWFYALSVALVLYSDYIAYLILPVQFVYVVLAERKNLIKFIKFFSLGVVPILPWLTVLPHQLIAGRQVAESVPGWKMVVGGATIKDLTLVAIKSIIGRVRLFENLNLYVLSMLVIGSFYGWLIYLSARFLNKEEKFLLCWLILPVLLAFIISFFVPVLSYFRFIFILPAMYILLANGLAKLSKNVFIPMFSVTILISVVCLFLYFLSPQYQRENWRYLVQFLDNRGDGSTLVLFEDSNLPAPFIYYDSKRNVARAALTHFPASSPDQVIDIDINRVNKIFLVDYLVGISDPGRVVDKKLTRLGYRVIKLHNIPSLGFIYEYSR